MSGVPNGMSDWCDNMSCVLDRANAVVHAGLASAGLTAVCVVLAGCPSAPVTQQQTVIDTSASGKPVGTALPAKPKPPTEPSHNDLVVRHTIALGSSRRCLVEGGKLYCWGGWESRGDLGEPIIAHAKPTAVPGKITSVAMDERHSCVTTEDGRVWCWGVHDAGKLGNGLPPGMYEEPQPVLDLDDAVSVWVSRNHSCVIRHGGKVSCWGSNRRGEAGHTTGYTAQVGRLVRPIEVQGVSEAIELALNDDSTCAVTRGGETLCWGTFRAFGRRIGLDQEPHQPRPQPELASASRISGHDSFGCAVVGGGEVQCWGYNFAKRLGHNKRGRETARVEQLSDAVQLATGDAHACALLKSAELLCWGQHDKGQLGRTIDDPKQRGDHRALPVEGLSGVTELAAGDAISCARTRDHKLYCWGAKPWSNESSNASKPVSRRIR